MRSSDWSSDVCSSDLATERLVHGRFAAELPVVVVQRRLLDDRAEAEQLGSLLRAAPLAGEHARLSHAGALETGGQLGRLGPAAGADLALGAPRGAVEVIRIANSEERGGGRESDST